MSENRNDPDDWRPDRPMDEPDYLDGYLSAIYDDDSIPDGAWFEIQVSMIAEHWNMEHGDAHEVFLSYLEWKSHKEAKEEGK